MLGLLSLAGCFEHGDYCKESFAGGCVAGPGSASVASPAAISTPPRAASAPVGSISGPATISTTPQAASVPLGEPGAFADVDDKQCRSYGLEFGTHDYADCRIRLSAQHRGLDPNIGATTPGAGNR
jgi:hypothetical protein